MKLLGLMLPAWLVGAQASEVVRAHRGMVASESALATQVGVRVLQEGGTAVDAAVATAFALAVTYPAAGNLGGGGFLLHRAASGKSVAYDFREIAPAAANAWMFATNGAYDVTRHHHSHRAVGVPGTVAGLHLAWRDHGRLPWRRLVEPAVRLAATGFPVSEELARSLTDALPKLRRSERRLSTVHEVRHPLCPGGDPPAT
ncbi:MAG: gamma-glutamyltransferase [Verrucomicrobia bacterium]|nr:gamma-glutamyltransferase [Verrucomicrobiota bacterium]